MTWGIIIFILGIIVGVVVTNRSRLRQGSGELRGDLIARQGREKEENLKKILAAFAQASASQGNLSNDDVQKLFGVSSATATRYLEELERVGKISQEGSTGLFVTYELL